MGRMEKVNQTIKKEIGEIIQQELEDPRVQFVTITGVDVSKDLQAARVFYSVLGDKGQLEQAGEGLTKARGLIRKLLGQRITMRYTPSIDFEYDKSVEYGALIEKKLEEIKHEHQ